MNKVGVASVLLVLAAAATAATLSILYLRKKKTSQDKDAEGIIWSYHLDNVSNAKLKGKLDAILNADILKKSDYSAGGNTATVREVSHEFPNGNLNGWTHTYKYPLRIKKVVVDLNEINVQKLVDTEGFTFFNREGSPDFVTLWHDDNYHHYSTSGELLSVGAFPFADGDLSIHPDQMKLPKEFSGSLEEIIDADTLAEKIDEESARDSAEKLAEESTADLTGASYGDEEETDVPSDSKSSEEEDDFPEDAEEELPPVDIRNGSLIFDLSHIANVKPDVPYTYTEVEDELTLSETGCFTNYRKISYDVKGDRKFVPYVHYLESTFDLHCDDASNFVLYADYGNDPLVITLRDGEITKTFYHRGRNRWELVSVPFVDAELLYNAKSLMRNLAILDFSKHSGSYRYGNFNVEVKPNTGVEPFPRFKSFKHLIYRTTRDGSYSRKMSPKIYKYKYDSIEFDGLPNDVKVSSVTAFYWKFDLTKPLLLKVSVDKSDLDFVGYKDYILETDSSLLKEHLARLNCEFNRECIANILKHGPYDYKGADSNEREDVLVKINEHTPLRGFRKNVHVHRADDNLPFHLYRILGEVGLPEEVFDVYSLDAYFLINKPEKPLIFALNYFSKTQFFVLKDNEYRRSDMKPEALNSTLIDMAYSTYGYLAVDLTQRVSYHYTGKAKSASHNLVVKIDAKNLGFVKYSHSLDIGGRTSNFHVYDVKGVDLDFEDHEITTVEAYFCIGYLDKPLLVIFRGPTDSLYAYESTGFERKEFSYLAKLLTNLRMLAYQHFNVIFLNLRRNGDYTLFDDGPIVKVVTEDPPAEGFRKFLHIFPETCDLRFLDADKYAKPDIKPNSRLTRAVVIVDYFQPIFVTLLNDDGLPQYFKRELNAWKVAEGTDLSLVPVTAQLTGPEVHTGTGNLSEMRIENDFLFFDLGNINVYNLNTRYYKTKGQDELSVIKTYFNDYFKRYTYTLSLKSEVKNIQLLTSLFKRNFSVEKLTELTLYVDEGGFHILVTLVDKNRLRTLFYRGYDFWEEVAVPKIDLELLVANGSFVFERPVLDFSKTSDSYHYGIYRIDVKPSTHEPFDRFKSFTHTINKSDLDYQNKPTGIFNATPSLVYWYKFDNTPLSGLIHDKQITSVTAFFWKHDLTKPLLLRLTIGNSDLNFVGYKQYVKESNSNKLADHLARLNCEFNRECIGNISKHEAYDYKGDDSDGKVMLVTVHENTPLKGFRKNVHSHKAGDNHPFHLLKILGDTGLPMNILELYSFETYFLSFKLDKPLMVVLKYLNSTTYYSLKSGIFRLSNLPDNNLEHSLLDIALSSHRYIAIDPSKQDSYHHTGLDKGSRNNNIVVAKDESSLAGFVKFTHTFTYGAQSSKFHLLDIKGTNIVFEDDELSSVEAYFFNGYLDKPVLVALKGASTAVYAAEGSAYVKKDDDFLTNDLLAKLLTLPQKNFELLFLKLDQEANYYDANQDRVSVAVSAADDGSIENKFIHTFPESQDVRFLVGNNLFTPELIPNVKICKAIVTLDYNKSPTYVSLFNSADEGQYFKKEQDTWKVDNTFTSSLRASPVSSPISPDSSSDSSSESSV